MSDTNIFNEVTAKLEHGQDIFRATTVDRLLHYAMELRNENAKMLALLKRLSWTCWNLDNNEELPDEIGGDMYSELLNYIPEAKDFDTILHPAPESEER
jgi:hypothetical protein